MNATPEALAAQGAALYAQARYAEAAERYQAALRARPEQPGLWTNFAAALAASGRHTPAREALRHALRLDPDAVEALNNYGAALDRAGKPQEAAACYRRALALAPAAALWNNLGNVHKSLGRSDEAVAAYREALRLDPTLFRAHSNLLLVLNYLESVDGPRLAAAHRAYGEALARRVPRSPRPPIPRLPGEPLRVGFISADLYNHPVGRLLLPVLEARPGGGSQWLLYAQNTVEDALSARLRAAADGWCAIAGLDDDALEARLRADRVHVLVDLAGHTAGNRLPFFARHVAAVQVAWLGYAGSTGLAAMDWLLADHASLPPEDESLYVERIWRVPESYVCFAPPADAPGVAPPPALASGTVTFAAFNNPAKITDRVLAVWARILARQPGSRLLFKNRCFAEPATAARMAARIARHGVGPERLAFEGESCGSAWYAAFGRVDIALDPFPFTGLMTSLDTLWMGVPLVTLAGRRGMLSRHGAQLVRAVGRPEWACADEAEYVHRALALAADPTALAHHRQTLRAALLASPLLAPGQLAAQLEHAFNQMLAATGHCAP